MMHYRQLRLAILPSLLALLGACGSSGGSQFDADAAASREAARVAVSASPQLDSDVAGKDLSKIEPVSRPGAEAPLNSTPDRISKHIGKALFATGFESGVELQRDDDSGTQRLVGADGSGFGFPISLSGVSAQSSSVVLSEFVRYSHYPAATFLNGDLKPVADRNGNVTRALSLHSRYVSTPNHNQQISMGSSGLSSDPVVFQRMWLKFDEQTLQRARQVGSGRFYQTFWEMKGEGERWLRLKLHYDDAKGLVWVAKSSGVAGSPAYWTDKMSAVPVTLAPQASAEGWHKVEIYLDPKEGRFKVAIDGNTLVDRAGVVVGDGSNWIKDFRMMMVSSTVAPLAEVLFDDLEIWDLPPEDAFSVSE